MELSERATERQVEFYQHRFNLWRSTEVINASDDPGKPEKSTGSLVLTDVPGMLQTGQSQQAPDGASGMLLDESDNLFTLDKLYMEAGIDVRIGDALFFTVGTEPNTWFTARGNPQVRQRLNYQIVLCSRSLKAPAWVETE